MTFTLEDEQGTIEVTLDVFLGLLKETFGVGMGNAVMYLLPNASNKQVVKILNKLTAKTWNDPEWIENYIHYCYKRAREIMQEEGKLTDEPETI